MVRDGIEVTMAERSFWPYYLFFIAGQKSSSRLAIMNFLHCHFIFVKTPQCLLLLLI
jgi:hypothetical protein